MVHKVSSSTNTFAYSAKVFNLNFYTNYSQGPYTKLYTRIRYPYMMQYNNNISMYTIDITYHHL